MNVATSHLPLELLDVDVEEFNITATTKVFNEGRGRD